MPAMSRQDLLTRFRAMIDAGRPIIGGGAGTGLSAKCEEEGGIDLIVIYNSGRYRMAGRGSLAGMMPYGDANGVVVDMAREVLPVVARTPVLAGSGSSYAVLFEHATAAAAAHARVAAAIDGTTWVGSLPAR